MIIETIHETRLRAMFNLKRKLNKLNSIESKMIIQLYIFDPQKKAINN